MYYNVPLYSNVCKVIMYAYDILPILLKTKKNFNIPIWSCRNKYYIPMLFTYNCWNIQ